MSTVPPAAIAAVVLGAATSRTHEAHEELQRCQACKCPLLEQMEREEAEAREAARLAAVTPFEKRIKIVSRAIVVSASLVWFIYHLAIEWASISMSEIVIWLFIGLIGIPLCSILLETAIFLVIALGSLILLPFILFLPGNGQLKR